MPPLLSRSPVSKRKEPGSWLGGEVGPAGQVRDLPAFALVLVRKPLDDAVVAQGDQVERWAVGDVRDGQGQVIADRFGNRPGTEQAGAFVGEDVQLAGGIEEGGIGGAIVVEVGPGEGSDIFQVSEWADDLEGAIAVVSEDYHGAGSRSRDDVEVAVHFNVGRPDAEVVRRQCGLVEPNRRRDIGELAILALAIEAQPAGAGTNQVRAEVVVPVNRQDAVGRRWDRLRPAGKFQGRRIADRQAHLAGVGDENHGLGVLRQPHRQRHVPAPAGDRLGELTRRRCDLEDEAVSGGDGDARIGVRLRNCSTASP